MTLHTNVEPRHPLAAETDPQTVGWLTPILRSHWNIQQVPQDMMATKTKLANICYCTSSSGYPSTKVL